MKKVYVSPFTEKTPFKIESVMDETSNYGYNPRGKENSDVVEEDEEETSLVEKEVKPLAFHSNNYLKKVWD
jgi:hypothetical protein